MTANTQRLATRCSRSGSLAARQVIGPQVVVAPLTVNPQAQLKAETQQKDGMGKRER